MAYRMTIEWLNITWRISGYAYAWILIPFIVVLILYQVYLKNSAIRALAGSRERLLFLYTSPWRRRAKALAYVVAILFLGVALLRPQWGKKEKTVQQEGRDVLIALDISRSMLAQDMEPNRLECAKKCIKAVLPLLSCERVGLIVFSGSAFIQCPLTEDYSAFSMFLDHVDVETISSGSTALDSALTQALNVFARIPDKKNKLLVVLTDGEDFSSNLSSVRERAQDEGLHVFAIGVGSHEGAPIPLYNEKGIQIGHQRDEQGNVVLSKLNQDMLQQLVKDVSGQYVHVKDDREGLQALVKCIQQYEKEKFEEKTWLQLQEQYPYFLAVSFICFALEWLL